VVGVFVLVVECVLVCGGLFVVLVVGFVGGVVLLVWLGLGLVCGWWVGVG
jgi:hypothetical protein